MSVVLIFVIVDMYFCTPMGRVPEINYLILSYLISVLILIFHTIDPGRGHDSIGITLATVMTLLHYLGQVSYL